MNLTQICDRQNACEAILKQAGQAAKARFEKHDFETQMKGPQDFVSEVDHTTEWAIKDALARRFPDDGFMGEESGGDLSAASWIVDPIDGTSNFVRGTAYWCLSAAFVVNGVAMIGIIYDPMLDEVFSCRAGGGAYINGRAMSVSKTATATDAVLGISFSFQSAPDDVARVVHDLIENGTSFRLMGAGALSLAHCAAGRTDGFWESFMKPWDAAAGLLLIKEAGGAVSDYGAGNGYVTGNPVLGAAPSMADFFSDLTGVALAKPVVQPA